MAKETQINLKFKLTVGSFLLWLSFFLPFVLVNLARTSEAMLAAFVVPAILALAGYLVSCWQDYKTRTPFSESRLIYVITFLIVVWIVMPVFVSAAAAASR